VKSACPSILLKSGALALALGGPLACHAGQELKWDAVPAAVHATVLANGGAAGQTVDRENGHLVTTKHDDAADRAGELAAAAKAGAGPFSAKLKFSHPRDIYNPYLPLAYLKQDILTGTEEGAKVRVERTLMPDQHKTFTIAGQEVEALAMEDREFHDGALEEVTLDYFAQDDAGNVYYLGEDVDDYKNGQVTGHDGAWLLGKDTQTPGVILPAHPKVGDKFQSEVVSKEVSESDEVVSTPETVTVPAGTYADCLKVKETTGDGATEYKYYAPGVGVVREVPPTGDEPLASHTAQ
jgi:hypothetical protein